MNKKFIENQLYEYRYIMILAKKDHSHLIKIETYYNDR